MVEPGLHVDDAELAIFDFAVGGHHPDEVDAVARCGDVRVIAGGHEHASPSRTSVANSGVSGFVYTSWMPNAGAGMSKYT